MGNEKMSIDVDELAQEIRRADGENKLGAGQLAEALMPFLARSVWQDISTAPKDEPIIGWCVHEADPYYDEATGRLTDYGCWAEALRRVPDGLAILEWGGEDSDIDERSGETLYWPNWWFRVGSEFEETANPTHWMPLPQPPSTSQEKSNG